MKFLHISDLHIGKRVNEFSMIEDQKYILRQIKEIALEKQVAALDALLLGSHQGGVILPAHVLYKVLGTGDERK